MLVIMAGLPGSGKSTLCRALAALAPSVVLNKDSIREALFGLAHTDYSREQDDLCGSMMLAAAEYLLSRTRSLRVYLDGRTYSRGEQLRSAVELANRLGVPWRILHCVCPDAVARHRLERAAKHPARNRNFRLYLQIKASFDPIELEHLVLDTSRPPEACASDAASYLSLTWTPR